MMRARIAVLAACLFVASCSKEKRNTCRDWCSNPLGFNTTDSCCCARPVEACIKACGSLPVLVYEPPNTCKCGTPATVDRGVGVEK
jgi:hypothetical protein